MEKKKALEEFQRSYLDLYAHHAAFKQNPQPPRFCAQYKAPHSDNALARKAEKQTAQLEKNLAEITAKTAADYREKAEQKRSRSLSTGFFTHHTRQNKTSAPPPRRHSFPPTHPAPH